MDWSRRSGSDGTDWISLWWDLGNTIVAFSDVLSENAKAKREEEGRRNNHLFCQIQVKHSETAFRIHLKANERGYLGETLQGEKRSTKTKDSKEELIYC